jgi:hypothetical protein
VDFRRKVIAAVGNLPHNGEPPDELVDATFGLLAAALSKMDPVEREDVLLAIEEDRTLQAAVALSRFRRAWRWMGATS